MKTLDLTIFANFFIDSEERFQRMKDSFYSFYSINPNQWVINVRGKYKYQVADFLKNEVNVNLEISFLDSFKGWMHDSRNISKKIISNYVFFWVEDNILVNEIDFFYNCVLEMQKFTVDVMLYTFFTKNTKKVREIAPVISNGNYIIVKKNDKELINIIKKKNGINFFVIGMPSIFEKNFFLKNLFSSKPYLKRWPRKYPFDFEKYVTDKIVNEFKFALPKNELFACIDDDLGEDGYSLISRGLYPNRIKRSDLKKLEFKYYLLIKKMTSIFPKKLIKFFARVFYTINIFYNK